MTLPLLFQFAKKNEKVMPPACIKFCTQPPLSLALLLSFPPMPPPPPTHLPGNYCTVP